MELKWNKFVHNDSSTYPNKSGYYLVFCIYSGITGKWYPEKKYVYYKGCVSFVGEEQLAGEFDLGSNSTGSIILYWADVPEPEGFKKDFPF